MALTTISDQSNQAIVCNQQPHKDEPQTKNAGLLLGRKVVTKKSDACCALAILVMSGFVIATIVGVSLIIAGCTTKNDDLLTAGLVVGLIGASPVLCILDASLGCRSTGCIFSILIDRR